MTNFDPTDLFNLLKQHMGARIIVAMAGAPASGKSTIAEQLVVQLNQYKTGFAALAPLDGFHLDDAVLKSQNSFAVKGAPHTFDVSGFGHMIKRLKQNDEAEIAVPLFDRELEISRAGARMIGQQVKIILVEGNYLLLDRPEWQEIWRLYDVTIFVEVPRQILKQRLVQRWQSFDYTPAMIVQKLNVTDMPNVELIIENSRAADHYIQNYDLP